MKRLFWIALGATVGIVAVRKLSRKAEQFTPHGLADQVSRQAGGLAESVRTAAAEIRAGMDAREAELRTALGLDADRSNGHRGLDPQTAARFADDTRHWRDEP